MEFTYFIGCDVSKNELDFAVMHGNRFLFHQEIANTQEAIKTFLRTLKKQDGFDVSKAVFCMEHTGIYNNNALNVLHKNKVHICLEAATQIKNSLGNIRGKNDKIDAMRIAEYAYKNREVLRLWQPKREVVQQLSHLSSTRTRLVEAKKMLSIAIKEGVGYLSNNILKENQKICQCSLKALTADLERAEKAIEKIVQSDHELNRLFNIITSVSGVGAVTATQIIITTNEFKDIKEPKKFACYAGVAPFTKESGLFKGKARVSHMANKDVKKLLHMSALAAIVHDPVLKKYYDRKVNEEKRNKMLVINAVRNKIVLRVFACVNQNRKYEKNYIRLVA